MSRYFVSRYSVFNVHPEALLPASRSSLRCPLSGSGSHLLSHTVSSIVPSAAYVLTIVFGMRTGVSRKRIATRSFVINYLQLLDTGEECEAFFMISRETWSTSCVDLVELDDQTAGDPLLFP